MFVKPITDQQIAPTHDIFHECLLTGLQIVSTTTHVQKDGDFALMEIFWFLAHSLQVVPMLFFEVFQLLRPLKSV